MVAIAADSIEYDILQTCKSHLAEVPDLLVDLKACTSDLEMATRIGQRFNGTMGTIAFQKEQPCFDILYQAVCLAENTCRLYEAKGYTEVDEEHIEFIERCYSFCNELIDFLLEGGEVTDSLWKGISKLAEDYAFLPDVQDRENLGQDDVDKLLDDL